MIAISHKSKIKISSCSSSNLDDTEKLFQVSKKLKKNENFFENEFYLSNWKIEQEISIKYVLVFSNDNNGNMIFFIKKEKTNK